MTLSPVHFSVAFMMFRRHRASPNTLTAGWLENMNHETTLECRAGFSLLKYTCPNFMGFFFTKRGWWRFWLPWWPRWHLWHLWLSTFVNICQLLYLLSTLPILRFTSTIAIPVSGFWTSVQLFSRSPLNYKAGKTCAIKYSRDAFVNKERKK